MRDSAAGAESGTAPAYDPGPAGGGRAIPGRLRVPGAEIYHEVSGSGPVLLLIPGGTDDARDYRGVVPLLEPDYRTVVYDCRGISRSKVDDPGREVPVATSADDAHRLVCALGNEPVYVFGSSSGGQIALDLTARHPEQVRAVVAHEPPAARLLPRDDPRRDAFLRIRDLHRTQGAAVAMAEFVATAGFTTLRDPERYAPESEAASAEMQERLVRMHRNLDFFFACVLVPAASYVPDAHALRGARVVIGVGDASEGQLATQTADAVAAALDAPMEAFPGGHAGFVSHPESFAARLRTVLAEGA